MGTWSSSGARTWPSTPRAPARAAAPGPFGADERGLDKGEPGWLTAGLFLEIASFFCYVALFRGVIGQEAGIGWAQSYRITLASLAATRLLAAGGIGGIALTPGR